MASKNGSLIFKIEKEDIEHPLQPYKPFVTLLARIRKVGAAA